MADADIISFLDRRKAQDAGVAMVATRSSNPDAAARANVLARRLGLPADAIERQLPEVEGREQLSVARSLIERYPAIGNWMSEPRNAAMGRDDVENLARVVKTFNGLPSTFAQKKLPFVRATPEEVRAARRPDGGFMASSDRIDAIMFEDNLNKFLTAAQDQAQDSTFELITRGPEAAARAVPAGVFDTTSGIYGLGRAATEIGADYSPVSYAQRKLFGRSIEDGIAQWFAEKQAEGQALAAQVAGAPLESRVGRDIVAGVRSVPMTAAALAASAAGAPQAGAALIGASVAGQEYGRARDKGISPVQSAIYAGSQGIIEYATERVPALKYFEDTRAGATFTRKLINNLGSEMPQEQVATVLQDLNEWAILNPDKPFSDYLDERPNAALSTAIATATGSIVTTTSIEAAGRLVNGAAKAALRRQEAEAATRTGELLDGLSKVDSKVRKRDPEAYGEFVSQFTDGTTIEDTYLNGEKVTELFQSGVINPEDSKWLYDVVAPQVGGVRATGGDYVVRTADFVSYVAGTPAWDALKDHVRFSPAGMSVDEARRYEEDEAKAFEELGRKFADDIERQRLEMRPREVLYEAIRDKLTNAGFTQSAADTNASMMAARYATRAQRLGKELTGKEADSLVVNQVLPEKLAPVVAADQLDIAIDLLKRGRDPKKPKTGDSLLEWISRNGGVEDPGGDIASMGGDRWHREKGFRKKLIRAGGNTGALPGMGGGIGKATGYGLDDMALRAWEAGYFPESVERPTVNDMLEAIDAELRGTPRYATKDEGPSADMRAAVEDLEALLEQQGLDTEKASPKEIREAVSRYQSERSEGRGYDQVDTKSAAFKKWFGNSKVVDEAGKPLVVYHGTVSDIESFDSSRLGENTGAESAGLGFFFTDDTRTAESYGNFAATDARVAALLKEAEEAERRGDWDAYDAKVVEYEALDASFADPENRKGGQNVVPVYLSLQNPLRVDAGGENAVGFDIPMAIKQALRKGHDGLIIENLDDAAGLVNVEATHFVVFKPTQIKSVFNRGTFDPTDPRILNQSFADGPRGRITFTEGRNIIDLFQARDLSTFVHETGHLWLEELRADAESAEASDQVKADWETVKAWFKANGHEVTDQIPVDAHEMWARGWERYAMEGKSPSTGLRKVFDAFRSWLLAIYKVVDNLSSPITPEIREVMDRLIATDEEITQAAQDQNIKALFTDAAQAGMTEAEFAAYQKATLESRDEAFDALLYRTMEAIRRQRLQWWKDEEASVRAEVSAQVDNRPEFRALAALRGKAPRIKLDRAWLAETYGEDAIALLPGSVPPIYADKDTTSADIIAEMSGFRTGDDMVRTLFSIGRRAREMRAAEDKRSVRQAVIDEEVAAVMRERHGDPLSDGSIQEEALAAIHNEKQGEVIASEIRALARRADRQPTPYKLAREWAARTVAESRVVDSTSGAALQRYAKAAAKAGKLAEEAMFKGDIDETFRQKQAQMLNNALIAEAKKAKEQVDAAVARLGKLARKATIASIDQAYLDQVHGLLEQVDFRPVSQRSLDRQESFEEWANAQTAAGYDVVVPPSFAERLGKRNWSRLSVEELLGLDETVKQIVHLGRLKQKLIDAKEEREFEAVVNEALGSVSRLPPLPPSDLMEPSRWDAIKGRVASMDAALLKMETVFDWLDGKDPNGVFNRVVFRRIADAQDAEKAMQSDYIGRLTELLRQLPKAQLARWSEKVTAPELLNRETGNPWVLTRDQLISVALNMGNEGNADKLARGYGWNRDAIMRVLDRELSADDWRYIQGVWDIIETLWPQIAAMEKRLNGVEPEKVEATPLQTSAGPLRGGYFPVVYDPRKSIDADVQAAKNSDSLFENVYTKATTPKGFTKARTNVARPIHLSLGVINRHVAEVIHDLTHREAIMDADRFLGDRRVMEAVDNTLGPEVRKQFRPWLQHIANEWANDRKGLTGWEAFAKRLRTNSTMVGMGFRISTIIMQAAGYSNTAERIGAKWVLQGIGAAAKNPLAAWRFVSERSGEVRNRMDTLERDIRENVRSTLGKHDVLSEARRFAFYGIGMMDRVVVIPTWIGAYNRAITEGMSEEEAGYFADKAVRQSQGAGAAKDLAAVQRSNEFMRLVTMFYSYQSAVYQRFRSLGRDIGTARSQDIPHLVARSFFLIAVPPLLSQLLAGRGPDDDEDWAMWAFQQMLLGLFGPIPLARDAANALESGFGYSFTPAARAFETGLNVVKDARKVIQGEETTRATRNALEATGYVFGLPTGQLATAAQFIVDVSEGEKDPNSVGDWWQGLTTGKIDD